MTPAKDGAGLKSTWACDIVMDAIKFPVNGRGSCGKLGGEGTLENSIYLDAEGARPQG